MRTSDARKLVSLVDRVAAERVKRNRSAKPPRATAPRSIASDGEAITGAPAIVDRFWVALGSEISPFEFPSGNQSSAENGGGSGTGGYREVVDGVAHVDGPVLGSFAAEKITARFYYGPLGGKT